MTTEAERCLSNNLDWYRSVLACHGLAGTISGGLWTCSGHVPPYYSNAITVAPDETGAQLAALADLRHALARPFAVKDAFATLPLARLGFRELFAAEWIWRDPAPVPAPSEPDWHRVTTPAALAEWEAAWRENGSPADRRVFLPALLDDPSVALFARYDGDRIVAGCAGNRSSDAVGFSNFFTADPDQAGVFAAGVAAVSAWAAGLPVVGYESDEALAIATGLGFRTVGPLRVWLATAALST